jgi:hypothetical protein
VPFSAIYRSTKRFTAPGWCLVVLWWTCAGAIAAQDANPAHPDSSRPVASPVLTRRPETLPSDEHAKPATISLTVPKGTAIQVALDGEVRIRKEGQPLRGYVVQPVYAFDKLVIPVGTEVGGQITRIEPVSFGKRTLAALDADFTPARAFAVEFSELILADGQHIAIRTLVTPGSGQVIQFLAAKDDRSTNGLKRAASEKATRAKLEARREWDAAIEPVKQPGKMRRAERYAIAQLPAHPQYIDAGSVYFAELQEPLEFGQELLTQEMVASLAADPPPGTFVQARLLTPLSSATTPRGAAVEAIVSKPVFDEDRLILPQGTHLKGSVVQVQAARYMSRNGQLRMVFHELSAPDGPNGRAIAQKVAASLEGVQSSKASDVRLDAEGGAEATTPKTRYLQTGIAIGLAMVSVRGDPDAVGADSGGNTLNRAAGGANGFKLVGIAMGVLVHSRVFGYSMGAYGAGMSIFTHFVARGRDVVFPKNTEMDIGIGAREAPSSNKSVNQAPDRDKK